MPIPAINLDFCSEPVDLHCPVCGQLIFALGVQQKSCPHLLFLGDSATENWSWQQEKYAHEFNLILQKKFAEACKNGFYGSLDDYMTTVRAAKGATIAADVISRKSAFMISISTSDIGCGGMHNGTIYAIFDYLTEAHELITNFRILESTK
ncbi:MAG: hypothetical protein QM483_12345 [Desulfuromusa sp.]